MKMPSIEADPRPTTDSRQEGKMANMKAFSSLFVRHFASIGDQQLGDLQKGVRQGDRQAKKICQVGDREGNQ